MRAPYDGIIVGNCSQQRSGGGQVQGLFRHASGQHGMPVPTQPLFHAGVLAIVSLLECASGHVMPGG